MTVPRCRSANTVANADLPEHVGPATINAGGEDLDCPDTTILPRTHGPEPLASASQPRLTAAMLIRPACPSDADAIWSIIGPTIQAGGTYTLDPDMPKADALAYWMGPDKETFIAQGGAQDGAQGGGETLGTYYMRANQAGNGRHVCNCGYMTAAASTGKGVARRMCQHSMGHARSRGFRAMQFNFVVSTNERALRLWMSLGFAVVGRLPLAFDHPVHGPVDALVMFQAL